MVFEILNMELDSIRHRLQGTSTAQRLDALLDAIQHGQAGVELVAQALNDRSREVRQAAFLLLSDCSKDTIGQAIWNHLPFSQMQCLHTLTNLGMNSRAYEFSSVYLEHFVIADCTNTLICYWVLDYKHSFIQTWDLLTGEPKEHKDLTTHEFGLGKEGRVIVVTYQDWLWTLSTAHLEKIGHGHIDFFTSTHVAFAICPAKQPLVAASYTTDNAGELEIRNYETNDRHLYYKFAGLSLFTQWMMRCSPELNWLQKYPPLLFTPDGEILVSHFLRGRNESVLNVWQTESGELLHKLYRFPALTVMALAVESTGRIIACGLREDKVSVWELLSDRIIYTTSAFSPCAMSSDGRVLAYGTANHDIVIWDLAMTRVLCTLSGHTAPISAIAISGDREFIASHSIDGTVRIWGIPE